MIYLIFFLHHYCIISFLLYYLLYYLYKFIIYHLLLTCKSVVQSSNALFLCVETISSAQRNWMYLKTARPPTSSAHIKRKASRTDFVPSITSSMCVYGQAVASPQFKDHQIVSTNKYTPYIETPQLSATKVWYN